MRVSTLLRHPTAWLPIAMSLAALALVLGHVSMFGAAREADEGTAAHLFQLLLLAEVPLVAYFAISWLPKDPRAALAILAAQAVAGLAALAPVAYFHL